MSEKHVINTGYIGNIRSINGNVIVYKYLQDIWGFDDLTNPFNNIWLNWPAKDTEMNLGSRETYLFE